MVSGSTLTTTAVALAAAGLLAWLGLPAQPPMEAWPAPTPQAREAMATELARGVSRAWQSNEKQLAWEQAEILLEHYPEQIYAQRLLASKERLAKAAQQERWSKLWAYQTLEGGNWGRLSQAQIQSTSSSGTDPSSLIVRTGNLAQYQAVYLVPKQPLPADCQQPSGCIVNVGHGGGSTPLRLVPADNEGYRFTDPQRVLGWLSQREPISLAWSSRTPLEFQTQGLDLARMGLAQGPVAP